MHHVLTSARLPKPRFHYSPVVKAGPWILVSGMIALDAGTGALETGGPAAETAKILANLKAALPDLGLTVGQLCRARIYTTRFDQFPAINAAWTEALAEVEDPPARTSVGVSALPLGASVEIEFEFYGEDRS
jgi:2-iminobutanoate/2-iminopropanoate deaminase